MSRITVREQREGIESIRHKRIAPNTLEYIRPDGVRVIKLHRTDIIEFHPEFILLNTGGWQTITTKDRMNKFIGHNIRIYQQNSIWTVYTAQEQVIFFDGLKIDYDGHAINAEQAPDKGKIIALKKSVQKYAGNFVKALAAGKIGMPSSSDCWYCCMRTNSGSTLGEESGQEHIISHIKENYFVPSLIFRAAEVMPTSPACKSWIYSACNGQAEKSDWLAGIGAQQAEKALIRYLYRQLNIAA